MIEADDYRSVPTLLGVLTVVDYTSSWVPQSVNCTVASLSVTAVSASVDLSSRYVCVRISVVCVFLLGVSFFRVCLHLRM